jgi:acyl-CoA hydrolase
MTRTIAPDALDFSGIINPGDAIVWGQACGEPLTLIEALLDQRAALGPVSAFVGSSFSNLLKPDHADHIRFSSMGALGSLRVLAKAGLLDIIPCHVGQIGTMISQGLIGCDVALVQVSPADAKGYHSYGVINDYVRKAIAEARVVIAEVNAQVPYVPCDHMLHGSEIDYVVHSDRPLVSVPPARIGEADRATAALCAAYIEDGSILQFGIGAVPDAIAQLLVDRRDLGIHTGMIGDAFVDLVEAGAITNATKTIDRGISITGAFIGTRRLYDFVHQNPTVRLCGSDITHGDGLLSALPKLVSVNSAIEVDLTGQINAEAIGGAYMGGTGGQVDYVRGASRSRGGRSIIALPSTAQGGISSRIVMALSGPVTTARSEADVIVTEYGAAELKGASLAERARRLIAIAHPDFREGLERDAHALLTRGY